MPSYRALKHIRRMSTANCDTCPKASLRRRQRPKELSYNPCDNSRYSYSMSLIEHLLFGRDLDSAFPPGIHHITSQTKFYLLNT